MMGRKFLPCLLVTGLVFTACLIGSPSRRAGAGIFHQNANEPPDLEQVARLIDHIQENLLDQGTVVIKQPDIWSQARMTMFRREFEDIMKLELTKFEPRLAARIARSDFAALQSQTAFGASVSPLKPGTSLQLDSPDLVAKERADAVTLLTEQSKLKLPEVSSDVVQNFSLLNQLTPVATVGDTNVQGVKIPLGLEPNIVVDEHADYITHLQRLRRVNLGDDNADSAGYGLYLMRVPVSIQPGECTYHGHGAIVNITMSHDFGPKFLAGTYRNLVINDIIDKLSPFVLELIRTGRAYEYHEAVENYLHAKEAYEEAKKYDPTLQKRSEPKDFHPLTPGTPEMPEDLKKEINDLSKKLKLSYSDIPKTNHLEDAPVRQANFLAQGKDNDKAASDRNYVDRAKRAKEATEERQAALEHLRDLNVGLPVNRTGSRINAIAPSDVPRVFVPQNLLNLAYAVQSTLGRANSGFPDSQAIRLVDIRSYLRHELESAYDLVSGQYQDQLPILMDVPLIEALTNQVIRRGFEGEKTDHVDSQEEDNDNYVIYEGFAHRLPGNLRYRPIGVLSWAIAIEAGLLNRHLRRDMQEVQTDGFVCPANIDGMFFYTPIPTPDAELTFQEYVKARWPMITFALEPVTDQQNIEDAFTRRRDLQIAIAFALASGRLSFRQAIQYTRQLQYEAQTISLNQTVAAFAHGNDTFGWRFTPRYQTPPEETNPEAVFNLLWRGGPGPDYQLRHSKLEPGLRELTAVVVMPSFVRSMRLDVSTNWFPLHDPDERKTRTSETVGLGRRINEARNALDVACRCGRYRPEDTARLRTKLHQLEAMLALQTYHVKVPYENTLGGFALFTQGVTALVPEVTGFDGVEYLDPTRFNEVTIYGKHFSLYEMEVMVGGESLRREGIGTVGSVDSDNKPVLTQTTISPLRDVNGNLVVLDSSGNPISTKIKDTGSYNILSREVLRVRIPPGVAVTTREDGTRVVEVFVANPNGVSNRIQIPVLSTRFPAQNTGRAYFLKTTSLTVPIHAFLDSDHNNKLTPFETGRFELDQTIGIQATDTKSPQPSAIDLRFTFPVPGDSGAVLPTIDIRGVPLIGDTYVIQSSQLQGMVDQLFQSLKINGLLDQLTNPVTAERIQVIPISHGPAGSSKIDTPLTLNFQMILMPNPQANASTAAPGHMALDPAASSPVASGRSGLPPLPTARPSTAGEPDSTDDPRVRPVSLTPVDSSGRRRLVRPVQNTPEASTPPPPPSPAPAPTPSPAPSPVVALPSQTSRTLLVMPQSPTVNIAVPVYNLPPTRHHGLFHRRNAANTPSPVRGPFLERLLGRP